MSSYFGKNIHFSIFGQSHSDAIGVVIDDIPAGIPIDMEALIKFLLRRSPMSFDLATPRKEADRPTVLSGIRNNITCGAPIAVVINNTNTISKDYENLRFLPRPSHADYVAHIKHNGFQDVAGGGHFSGRLTAPLCVVGGILKQILAREGIKIAAHIRSIYDIEDSPFDTLKPEKQVDLLNDRNREFPLIDLDKKDDMRKLIRKMRDELDSVGGVVEACAVGVPIGLGNPMLEGVENIVSKLSFAIPAVKGIEFGNGFEATRLRGSENNDCYTTDGDKILTTTNNHGGILGGITSGMPIIFRVGIKPTPSIARPQQSVNLLTHQNETLSIHGRHDPCIVPRAVPAVESVLAIALYECYMSYKEIGEE